MQQAWARKPPLGAQINRGSSLAKNLVSLVMFNTPVSGFNSFTNSPGIWDLARNQHGFCYDATSLTYKFNSNGYVLNFGSTSTDANITNTQDARNSDWLPTTSASVFYRRRKTDTTLRSAVHWGMVASGGTQEFKIQCPWNNGSIDWDFGGNGSPNRLSWAGYSVSTDMENWVFTAGTKGSSIWFNGVQRASQSTPISRVQDSGRDFFLGGTSAGSSDLVDYDVFAMWSRELTDREIMLLHLDPYAMMVQAPAVRPYFVNAPAADVLMGQAVF